MCSPTSILNYIALCELSFLFYIFEAAGSCIMSSDVLCSFGAKHQFCSVFIDWQIQRKKESFKSGFIAAYLIMLSTKGFEIIPAPP